MKLERLYKFITMASVFLCIYKAHSQTENLPRGLADFERPVELSITNESNSPPIGPIRVLPEWEDAEAVMTLWANPSLVSALADHGHVKILADPNSTNNETWWKRWLDSNKIRKDNVSFFNVSTDSIWVRDYGPLFILDGVGNLGIVDTIYNRPRPNDDKVPKFIGKELGVPVYQPDIVHTGGNFYSDGGVSGFSSTLVYSENKVLKKQEIDKRMLEYLGIERYSTLDLGPGLSIEHLDTFGKLVSADTWVFSEFPEGSQFRSDSENYVRMLEKLLSPYGTPYKIFRMKMHLRHGITRATRLEDYRAYINSFISNQVLYFPTYGDPIDSEIKAIYQNALPGYEIVGIDNRGTEWGDSIHCRTRNLFSTNSLHLFASVEKGVLVVEAYPSAGGVLKAPPTITVQQAGEIRVAYMSHSPLAKSGGLSQYVFSYPLHGKNGETISYRVEVTDSNGFTKSIPNGAPNMKIDYVKLF